MLHYHELPSEIQLEDFRIFAFDKDNTITPANKPIQTPMIAELSRFLRSRVVVILTARDMQICQSQIIEPIRNTLSDRVFALLQHNLIFGCSNGSQIYTADKKVGQYSLRSSLEGDLPKNHIFEHFIPEIAEIMEINPEKMSFERRSETMGVFVCIPRDSSDEERKNFDPNKEKRKKAVQFLEKNLKKFGADFEIIPAGSTSIDIAIYDKKAGMNHIIDYFYKKQDTEKPMRFNPKNVIFFGDGFDGGNDTSVEGVEHITLVCVKNEHNTQEILSKYPISKLRNPLNYV